MGGQPALAIGKPTLTAPTMHITIRAMYREPRDSLNGLILLPVAPRGLAALALAREMTLAAPAGPRSAERRNQRATRTHTCRCRAQDAEAAAGAHDRCEKNAADFAIALHEQGRSK